MLGKPAFFFSREDLPAVDGYHERAPAALDEFGVNSECVLQLAGQTGRAGKVVSFYAVFNADFHGFVPEPHSTTSGTPIQPARVCRLKQTVRIRYKGGAELTLTQETPGGAVALRIIPTRQEPIECRTAAAMLELIILSIVQGVAEFLPISSSGHLSLLQHLFGIEDTQQLDVFLHLATFFAIVVYFRRPIRESLAMSRAENRRLAANLGLATAVTVAFYLAFRSAIEASFTSVLAVGLGFLATTVVLSATRFRPEPESLTITAAIALAAGLAQGFAIFPGVSRSGSTIACLMLLGIAPPRAGFFSMMMFLPAIAGAVALNHDFTTTIPYSATELAIAFALTFAVSYGSLAFLMRFLRRGKFHHFAAWTFLMFVASLVLYSRD